MDNTQISCTIGTNAPSAGLGIEVWLNDKQLLNIENVANESIPVTWSIDDSEGQHELRFVLKNKTIDHTKIDETGNIISDVYITIDDVAFEEIPLNQVVTDQAVYTHNFNGTDRAVTDKFYGTMGCNGIVSLKFTTPIYLWLLENM